MSDSMAFLGGAAAAGLAALVLLKGGVNPGLSNVPTSPQVQPPVQPSLVSSPGQVSSPYPSPYSNLDQQQLDIARLKFNVEQLQAQNQQLKEQVQNQQVYMESLNSQAKANATLAAAQVNPGQPVAAAAPPLNPVMSGILWGVGGMVLTIGGGIVLIGMFALFSQQRPRTVQVIHPVSSNLPRIPSRRTEYLPPRLERRASQVEYDEY